MSQLDDLLQSMNFQSGGLPISAAAPTATGAPAPGSAPTMPAAPAAPGAALSTPMAQVLAKLRTQQQPAQLPQSIFSGVPDVKGMDRGAAFMSGISSGLADSSRTMLANNQLSTQQQAQNLNLFKTLAEVQNQDNSFGLQQQQFGETQKRDQTMADYYHGLIAAKNTENSNDTVESRQANAAKIFPPGTDPAVISTYVATGKPPSKYGNPVAPAVKPQMGPTEQKIYDQANSRVSYLQNSIDSLNGALKLSGNIYGGPVGNLETQASNMLQGHAPFVDPNIAANTDQYAQAIRMAGLSGAKELFPGRVTNYDEQLLQSVNPTAAKSPQARQQILQKMIDDRQQMLEYEQNRVASIKSGEYFAHGGAPPSIGTSPYSKFGAVPLDQYGQPKPGATPAAPPPAAPSPAAPAAAPTAIAMSGDDATQSYAVARQALAQGAPRARVEAILRAHNLDPGKL